MPEFWKAPTASKIDTQIAIPGAKSLTNRYLLLAALSETPTRLYNPLIANDTLAMATALESLGTNIKRDKHVWTITPRTLNGGKIYCGQAGTVMRFIPFLSALAQGESKISADPSTIHRPMDTTLSALKQLNIKVTATNYGTQKGMPLTIMGTGTVTGGKVAIDASKSSQFVSALLLCGAKFTKGVEIVNIGNTVPALTHIEMTLATLKEAGVQVETLETGHRWRVPASAIDLPDTQIEPDLSNAGAFLAAAMVTVGKIRIPNWPRTTTQPGDAYQEIFTRMGANVNLISENASSAGVLELIAPKQIRPLDMDLHNYGELVPTLAAVCAFATAPSRLCNIGQLRGHETDRLQALCAEFAKVGIRAEVIDDDLIIYPSPKTHGAKLESYLDHRMATFGAILGLRIPNVEIANIATTQKTLPNFPQLWKAMV